MFFSYRCGRKPTVIVSVILGGISCIVIALIPSNEDAGEVLVPINNITNLFYKIEN